MKRKIIVPTYEGHFESTQALCWSFEKNVTDDVKLAIVTTNPQETQKLRDLVGNVHEYYDFESLKEECGYTSSISYHLHPYQAVKKSVALKCISYDQALLMDSDAFFLSPLKLNGLFDRYFENPFIFHSSIVSKLTWINDNSRRLIDRNDQSTEQFVNRWNFEYHGWFVTKPLFNEFLLHIEKEHDGHFIDIMMRFPIFFEIMSYFWYLLVTNKGYNAVPIDLPFNNTDYGIVEMLLSYLNEDNYDELMGFVKEKNIEILRIQDNFNVSLCEKFLNEANISVIACSYLYSNRLERWKS